MCFSEQIFYRKQSLDDPVSHSLFFFYFLAVSVSIKMFKQNDKTTTIKHENVHQEKNFCCLCSCYNSQQLSRKRRFTYPNSLSLKIWRIRSRLQSILKKVCFYYWLRRRFEHSKPYWSQVPVLTSRYSAKSSFLCSTICRLGPWILPEINSSIGKTCKA